MLFYGLVAFLIHRILVLILIFRVIKLKDFIPLAIAMLPFLLIFTYLLFSSDVPEKTYYVLILQNLLIATLGGLALSNYIMQDDRKSMWLLISGLLFVALQFIVFIEKYFLSDLSPAVFRPIAMALNAFAFYTFLEFVLSSERSDDNSVFT
jgi:ABC-type transport system involved in cytochrome c biogenesis permease subunit